MRSVVTIFAILVTSFAPNLAFGNQLSDVVSCPQATEVASRIAEQRPLSPEEDVTLGQICSSAGILQSGFGLKMNVDFCRKAIERSRKLLRSSEKHEISASQAEELLNVCESNCWMTDLYFGAPRCD